MTTKPGLRVGGRRSTVTHSLSAEARVEQHSAVFKKELGLLDLVLTQIVYVVGVVWVGAAAKLGRSQVVFWLLAIFFFYLPQAAVVVHLSRRLPLEGGLYQWAKIGLGEMTGFMVAWNLWMYAVVLISSIGLIVATNLSYAFAGRAEWMASSRMFITILNVGLIGALALLAVVGLGVSKWVHNAGSLMLCAAFGILIVLPYLRPRHPGVTEYHPFAIAMPAVSLLSLNIFGKMAMGALSGFEYVAVLAGECKTPERSIAKATMIAVPIIALMFILGTSAVLAFTPPSDVNLISPIPQAIRAGLGSAGAAALVAPIAILLLTSRTVANTSIVFTGNTRMPMVAGWDQLLPQWFTRLHPRHQTPLNSILFVTAVSIVFSLGGIAGVGAQEAFQLLDNAAGIFYGLTYLVLFAIPLIGLRHVTPAPPRWLRIAAASGFTVTLLYVMLSVFPIVDVVSWTSFAFKIGGIVVLLNVVGVATYVTGRRRKQTGRTTAS